MKIKVHLSIGYPTACHDDILDIPDEELEGKSEEERDEYLDEQTKEWAHNYIEYSWKEK